MDVFDHPLTRSMYDPLCATLVIILFWKSYDIMFPTRHNDGQTSGERTFVDYNDGGPVLRKFCNCVMYLNVIRLFYYVVMNNRDINECPFSRQYWKYDELQPMFAIICVNYTIYLYVQIKTIEDDDKRKKMRALIYIMTILVAKKLFKMDIGLLEYFFRYATTLLTIFILKYILKKTLEKQKTEEKWEIALITRNLMICFDILQSLMNVIYSKESVYIALKI